MTALPSKSKKKKKKKRPSRRSKITDQNRLAKSELTNDEKTILDIALDRVQNELFQCLRLDISPQFVNRLKTEAKYQKISPLKLAMKLRGRK